MSSKPIQQKTSKETVLSLLSQNTPVRFSAHGSSMHPTICHGDCVCTYPIQPKDVRYGNILFAKKHSRLILHRVVSIDKKGTILSLTGDAALSGTEQVPVKDIVGVAYSIEKGGKTIRLNTAFQRAYGMLRYRLRPLRRAVCKHHQRNHAGTSES